MELFELAPDLVAEKIKLLEIVVLLEDPDLFFYFLVITKDYFRLSNAGLDARSIYNRREKEDAFLKFKHIPVKVIEKCYFFYWKVIIQGDLGHFFSK